MGSAKRQDLAETRLRTQGERLDPGPRNEAATLGQRDDLVGRSHTPTYPQLSPLSPWDHKEREGHEDPGANDS